MKKIVALVLAVMLLLSAASALAEFDQKVSFTVCTSQTQAAGDYNSDKLAKYVQEKFNVDYEVWPIAYDSQNEKVRVWINSESMPSLNAWIDWNISEYSEYVDQGLLGALPEGWEQDYPNLHRMIEKTGLMDKLTIDGKLYAVPNAVFGVFLDMDPITNHSTTWYRADWAEQLGYHFGDTATFAEFRKYLEDCIANNMSGMDATYGLVGTSDYVNSFFFDATGVDYDGFMETEDGMVWGPTLEEIPETIKMIRDWYQSGLIYPDYYLLSSTDAPEYFYVGNCAALRKDGPVSSHVGVAEGLEENGIDPSVAKPILLTGDDGVVHAQETTNYWTVIIFNPENDAETMARLCSMIDWLYSEEGILCCQMGVPGVEWDYDAEGKPYYLDAAIGEDGKVISQWDRNPSYRIWRQLGMLSDDFNFVSPAYDPALQEQCKHCYEVKAAGDVLPYNYDYAFYSSETKNVYSVDIKSGVTEVVIGTDDVDKAWQKFIDDNRGMWEPLLHELNAEYFGG